MARQGFWKRIVGYAVLAALAAGGTGCTSLHDLKAERNCCRPPDFNCCRIEDAPVPKELNKVSLPPYVVETPDILQIEAIRVIPLPPYRLEPLDVLYLTAQNVFGEFPLDGMYPVDPDGTIDL